MGPPLCALSLNETGVGGVLPPTPLSAGRTEHQRLGRYKATCAPRFG